MKNNNNNKNDHQSNHLFRKVPNALFLEIRDFLQPKQYFNLITSSNDFFHDVKYETWKIKVRGDLISSLIDDPQFRENILSKIKNPKQQLCLSSFEPLDNLIQFLSLDCYSMHFQASNLHEISNWASRLNDHTVVSLSNNQVITHFDGYESANWKKLKIGRFESLISLIHLQNLRSLELFACNELKDIRCLSKLRRLKLDACHAIHDLTGLGNIPHLTLHYCNSITDISPLTNNYRLTIRQCRNIDRSTVFLTNVVHLKTDFHQIFLNSLKKRKEIEKLKFLRTLTVVVPLHHQTIFLGSSLFTHLLEVSLTRCSIDDLSPLAGIPVVTLNDCKISSLAGITTMPLSPQGEGRSMNDFFSIPMNSSPDQRQLRPTTISPMNSTDSKPEPSPSNNNNKIPKIRTLKLEAIHNINDFSMLMNIFRVHIKACSGFTNGFDLMNVHHLILQGCHEIADISMLKNISVLELNACHKIHKLKGLENIDTIEIIYCPRIVSLEGLGGKNKKIVLHRVESTFLIQNERLLNPLIYHHSMIQEEELITHTFLLNE
jgi:hypothetical protein